jgi:hypothetical protein
MRQESSVYAARYLVWYATKTTKPLSNSDVTICVIIWGRWWTDECTSVYRAGRAISFTSHKWNRGSWIFTVRSSPTVQGMLGLWNRLFSTFSLLSKVDHRRVVRGISHHDGGPGRKIIHHFPFKRSDLTSGMTASFLFIGTLTIHFIPPAWRLCILDTISRVHSMCGTQKMPESVVDILHWKYHQTIRLIPLLL